MGWSYRVESWVELWGGVMGEVMGWSHMVEL